MDNFIPLTSHRFEGFSGRDYQTSTYNIVPLGLNKLKSPNYLHIIMRGKEMFEQLWAGNVSC